MQPNNQDLMIIESTKQWINRVVVGLNFCPFAQRVVDQQGIHYRVLAEPEFNQGLAALEETCSLLDTNPHLNTAMIILPEGFNDFQEYLFLVGTAESLLERDGRDANYQLASFHPDYCFMDADRDDAANFTNRSPFPMIHILRTSAVEEAIDSHADTESIPQTNIDAARQLGSQHLQALLDECRPGSAR